MPGTITFAHRKSGHIRRLVFECVGDAVNGTLPDFEVTEKIEGRLLKIVTTPGIVVSSSPSASTSPSASVSASPSPSSSSSASASITPSVSPSASASPSASSSPSASKSPSASSSPSKSPSASQSPSASASPSASSSPSASVSPSASQSASAESPTANYDVFLRDQSRVDLLHGAGVDRSNTTPQQAAIVYGTTSLPASIVGAVHPCVSLDDTLTLSVRNTTVPSARIQVEIYYAPGA